MGNTIRKIPDKDTKRRVRFTDDDESMTILQHDYTARQPSYPKNIRSKYPRRQ